MEKPSFEQSAQFSDSIVGMVAGKKYICAIVGSSDNSMATTPDNKNLVVGTLPLNTDLENVKASDWVPRTISSRALADCGITTAAQKRNAMEQGTLFIVGWNAGEERTGNDGRTYLQKVWSAKRYEEAE